MYGGTLVIESVNQTGPPGFFCSALFFFFLLLSFLFSKPWLFFGNKIGMFLSGYSVKKKGCQISRVFRPGCTVVCTECVHVLYPTERRRKNNIPPNLTSLRCTYMLCTLCSVLLYSVQSSCLPNPRSADQPDGLDPVWDTRRGKKKNRTTR